MHINIRDIFGAIMVTESGVFFFRPLKAIERDLKRKNKRWKNFKRVIVKLSSAFGDSPPSHEGDLEGDTGK